MYPKTGGNPRLCYLEASRVASPAGDLGGMMVETPSEEPIGRLSGVLIDPAAHRVRFFVVDSSRWLRGQTYLIPADCPAQVETRSNTLRVDVGPGDIARLDGHEAFTIERLSDEAMEQALDARQVA